MKIQSVLLVLLLPAWPCLAESSGSDTRPLTDREREFYAGVLATISKALPPGPLTWLVEEETPLAPPERIAVNALWHPLRVHYSITWGNAQRKKLAEMDDKRTLRNLGKAEEERARAEAQKKLDQLLNEKEEADKGQDITAAQVLDREITNLMVEIHQIKEFAEDPQHQEAPETLRDTRLRISVEVNLFSLPLAPLVRPDSLAALAVPLLREQEGFDSDGQWREGALLAFLGPGWRRIAGTPESMQMAEPVGLPALNAYALIVRVQGDIGRARSCLQAIDWLALQGLLFR